jgi:hypothetical protein
MIRRTYMNTLMLVDGIYCRRDDVGDSGIGNTTEPEAQDL